MWHHYAAFAVPLLLGPGWVQAIYRIGRWAWGTRHR